MSSNLISIVIFCFLTISGYAEEGLGFVRLVDAVNRGTGNLTVKINGEQVRPEGYQLGDITGGIALKPGVYQIVFAREGIRGETTQLTIKPKLTTTLIAFAEQEPKELKWEIGIMRLKQQEQGNQRTVTLVSVASALELNVEIKQKNRTWTAHRVERLKALCFENRQVSSYLKLRCGKREFSSVAMSDSGNGVMVWYEDEQGVLQMKSFLDYAYGAE